MFNTISAINLNSASPSSFYRADAARAATAAQTKSSLLEFTQSFCWTCLLLVSTSHPCPELLWWFSSYKGLLFWSFHFPNHNWRWRARIFACHLYFIHSAGNIAGLYSEYHGIHQVSGSLDERCCGVQARDYEFPRNIVNISLHLAGDV